MAFIREVKRGFYANGRPKRYYYLVENYRENGKVKQRQRYLGTRKPSGRRYGLPFFTKEQEEMIARNKRFRKPLMLKAGQLARSLEYRLKEINAQGYVSGSVTPMRGFLEHSFFQDLAETKKAIADFMEHWGYGDMKAFSEMEKPDTIEGEIVGPEPKLLAPIKEGKG